MKNNSWLKAGVLASIVSICLSVINVIPCIKCLIWPVMCFSWILIPISAGYLAALWGKIERNQYEEGAKQGALAGLTISIIGGSINLVINIILSLIQSGSGIAASFISNEDFLGDFLPTSFTGITYRILFVFAGCLCGFVLNILFATIGAIIRVALSKE